MKTKKIKVSKILSPVKESSFKINLGSMLGKVKPAGISGIPSLIDAGEKEAEKDLEGNSVIPFTTLWRLVQEAGIKVKEESLSQPDTVVIADLNRFLSMIHDDTESGCLGDLLYNFLPLAFKEFISSEYYSSTCKKNKDEFTENFFQIQYILKKLNELQEMAGGEIKVQAITRT